MTKREPQVFSLSPAEEARLKAAQPVTIVEVEDAFSGNVAGQVLEKIGKPSRVSVWGRMFWSAFVGLMLMMLTSGIYQYIEGLVQKVPALGYLALVLAGMMLLALLVMFIREMIFLRRLGRTSELRAAAEKAADENDREAARRFVGVISRFYHADPATARGRAAVESHAKDIIDGRPLIELTERELLSAKDIQVKAAIAAAASRVAAVTTLSPRAWVDVLFVLVQSVRLISQVATLYSGRPGGFAIWRLATRVLTHLAVTGGVAVTHDLVGQFLGAGIAGRISAKLGEGMLNGILTARVGLSAIAVCRPMPFLSLSAPALSDVAGSLLSRNKELAN